MQTPHHSVVVIDPKGQNAAVTARCRRAMGQDVFVINPFGLHTGAPWHLPRHRFNPLATLDIHSPNVVADAGAEKQGVQRLQSTAQRRGAAQAAGEAGGAEASGLERPARAGLIPTMSGRRKGVAWNGQETA